MNPQICAKCGLALPADAPEGLCPQCLMKGGRDESEGPTVVTPSEIENPKSQIAGAAAPPTPAALARHFPQLEIIELLGQGGMGVVYKARQPKLDRFVALKVLSAESGRDPTFAERFAREARALARLNHPNIVGVYDFGQAGGHFYFLMEFVDGVNLRELEQSRRLTPQEALSIVPKICEALQYAHDEGIVHRDIKPGNILIDKKGRVKIADFGLAKLLSRATAEPTLTDTGKVMCTPRYMAPEQFDHPQAVDHRADIYSLGVVFYEMLTGEVPMGHFAAPSQKVQIDVRLDEVVLKTLEREPERRYQHASEVKTDVEVIAGGSENVAAVGNRPRSKAPEPLREQLTVAAIGLWTVAAAAVTPGMIGLVQDTSSWISGGQPPPSVGYLLGFTCLFSGSILIAYGAEKLRRCERYELDWVSSVLALVAALLLISVKGHIIFLTLLVPALWALTLLHKPEVKAAFALSPKNSNRLESNADDAPEV